jgi:hypothetical protein
MVSPFNNGYNTLQQRITTAVALKVKAINTIPMPLLCSSKVMWGLRWYNFLHPSIFIDATNNEITYTNPQLTGISTSIQTCPAPISQADATHPQ